MTLVLILPPTASLTNWTAMLGWWCSRAPSLATQTWIAAQTRTTRTLWQSIGSRVREGGRAAILLEMDL